MVVAADFLFPKLIVALLVPAYSNGWKHKAFRSVPVQKDQINKEGKIVCLVAAENIFHC